VGVRVESDGSDSVHLARYALRVDDTSPHVTYHGAWTHAGPSSGYTAGDHSGTDSFSNTTDASAEFTFEGTGVDYVAAYGSHLGIVDVYIDGTRDAGVDLYGQNKKPNEVVYAKRGLSSGRHTIKVVATGRKNTAASVTYALVDAFEPIPAAGDDRSDQVVLHTANQFNYPDLSWGNHVKPEIKMEAGHSGAVRMRILKAGSRPS
jgi:hypothetical protein